MARPAAIVLDLHEVPKPNGGVRVMTTLGEREAQTYTGLVSSLVPHIVGSADPGVHGLLLGGSGLGAARGAWRRAVRALASGGFVVTSDVEACYPSIRPEAVWAGLLASSAPAGHAARLVDFLDVVEDAGTVGLPIGPRPSAIVAQSVLALADRAVRSAGGSIVRWADDVVIGGADRTTTLRAFDAWVATLRQLGLEPHEGKTAFGAHVPDAPPGADPSDPYAAAHGMMRAP